ncbi:MAG: hypothetical protein HY849_09890 [Nitrosomonadales bacterium]|nr:hypothetical protein [Nitrosomonadales bacterium]
MDTVAPNNQKACAQGNGGSRRLFQAKQPRCMAYNYFKMVTIEFDCLIPPPENERKNSLLWQRACALKAELDARAALQSRGCGTARNACIELAEVLKLEMFTLRLLPDERLLAKAWSIREAYRQLIPTETYHAYLGNNPPKLERKPEDGTGKESKLTPEQEAARLISIRQDAIDILAATHWWYTNSDYREKRISQVKHLLIQCLAVCVGFVLLLSQFVSASAILLPMMVILMGMLGAIFSIGRRILPVSSQNVTESDPVIKATQFDHGDTGIAMSIWIGGISALLLYLLMASGLSLIGGEILPKFSDALGKRDCNGLDGFACALHPADMASFVRLLCWSFLAGFAEKFVPDILDRMAKQDGGKRW